jgi:hypothetical protein
MDVYSGRLKWKDYKEKDLLILSIFLFLKVQQYGYMYMDFGNNSFTQALH